jgi:hypothetical protein
MLKTAVRQGRGKADGKDAPVDTADNAFEERVKRAEERAQKALERERTVKLNRRAGDEVKEFALRASSPSKHLPSPLAASSFLRLGLINERAMLVVARLLVQLRAWVVCQSLKRVERIRRVGAATLVQTHMRRTVLRRAYLRGLEDIHRRNKARARSSAAGTTTCPLVSELSHGERRRALLRWLPPHVLAQAEAGADARSTASLAAAARAVASQQAAEMALLAKGREVESLDERLRSLVEADSAHMDAVASIRLRILSSELEETEIARRASESLLGAVLEAG